MDVLLVIGGLALLVLGGEGLVRGASGLALVARVSPAVVGLTIVAAGTSMPELVVSMQAALAGSSGIAMGNVVGSNIFNIGIVIGLSALIRPLAIRTETLRLEWPVMALVALLLHLLMRDGLLDRLEGGCLMLALVAFTSYLVRSARKEDTIETTALATASFGRSGRAALWFNLIAIVTGVGILGLGSTLLVQGAVRIASHLGISETTIGLTIVAAGTSTPELVTSLVAAYRGQDDVAVGNVIGSNIFNILGIAGATALTLPIPIPPDVLSRDDWWMIGASLLLFPLMKTGRSINRLEGLVLICGFVTYTTLLIFAATG